MSDDDTTRRNAHRLAAETGADARTAQRWLEQQPVARASAYAFETAADKLGIPRPGASSARAAAGEG